MFGAPSGWSYPQVYDEQTGGQSAHVNGCAAAICRDGHHHGDRSIRAHGRGEGVSRAQQRATALDTYALRY